MASISNVQAKALNQVNKMISEVDILNQILRGDLPFSISIGRKQNLKMDPALMPDILSVFKKQRKRLVRDLRNLANKHGIDLDSSDESIISDAAIAAPESKEAVENEESEEEISEPSEVLGEEILEDDSDEIEPLF